MASIWEPKNKFKIWLKIEVLACEALAKRGEIPKSALKDIQEKSDFKVERIDEIEREVKHDVIAFLTCVAEYVGDSARYMHLGMTSSDVLDTALALQLKQASNLILKELKAFQTVLKNQALKHKMPPVMGRSHGIHAEPLTFGLKVANWYEEVGRNIERLKRARQSISYGQVSGAVGTFACIHPEVEEYVCSKLGLKAAPVSTQIIQRDRHAEFLTTVAIIGGSLEKFATEIRGLQKTEVREVEEPFAEGQTGSSSMPHKRNPEKCERITGIARILRGYASTGLENIALWHERDISHSSTERVILPDACLLLDYALDMFTDIVSRLQVYPERMLQNMEATHGLVFSQRVLLELVEAGLSRDDAYGIVQRNAMECWGTGQSFLKLLSEDENVTAHLDEAQLRSLFDYNYFLNNFSVTFERLSL